MQFLTRHFGPETVGRQWLDSAHGTALRLFSVGANLLIAIVSARLMGAEEFGVYVSYVAIAGLLATITSAGLPTLLAREIAVARGSGEPSDLGAITQMIFALHGLLLLAILISAIFEVYPVIWILAFTLATNILAVVTHVFMGFERVLTAQWINGVVRPVLLLAGFFVLAYLAALTVASAMYVQAGAALLATAVLWLMWRGHAAAGLLRSGKKLTSVKDAFPVLRTGGKFALAQFLINAMTQVDILILTALRPSEEVAWYYAAARAAMVVSFFFSSVSKMAEPKLVRLFSAGDMVRTRELVRSTALIGFAMTLVIILGALALGQFYLDFYGEGFSVAFPAMIVLMAGQLSLSVFGPAQPVLRACRADGPILAYAAISVAVGSGIAFALVMHYGFIGVALGMAVQFATFGLLLARRAASETGIVTWVFAGRD